MSSLPPTPQEPRWLTAPPRGRVLAFAPHPDDEAAGIGGTLCLHRAQGDPVRVVIATDGIAGDPEGRFAKAGYGERRRAEARAGQQLLGLDDARFWGFPDNCVLSPSDVELGVQRASQELQDFAPTLVYLPWDGEGHPDHTALHGIVLQAMARTRYAGQAFGYEVWNAMVPDLLVDISSVAGKKEAAILCHASQIAYAQLHRTILGLNAYRSLVHARGHGFAEALRRVR